MKAEDKIRRALLEIIKAEFGEEAKDSQLALHKTRKGFEGDFTLMVFPLVKIARQSPEHTAELLGKAIMEKVPEVAGYNIIKGFLNLSLKPEYWLQFLDREMNNTKFGFVPPVDEPPIVVEYSSPNTNKPLHLGHVRNNLLGFSVSRILEATGKKVIKVNLVNDRGIHICKSMLAWMKSGLEETPESTGKKGDKLVGDYYVRFESALREEVKDLLAAGNLSEEEARKAAPLMQQAQDLLRRWEQHDPQTRTVWEMMNNWVYEGFDATYQRLGVSFDKVYHESDTYLLGKDLVNEGLNKGIFKQHPDASVWVDLTDVGLDEKLLLRSDGTSVYITQDLGTAQLRYDDFKPAKMIYVVGNEQNYHFEVLQKIVAKLGKPYADAIYHLNYGMVELPEGKMKSREGTVVDADDLLDEMYDTARRTTEELGKIQDFGPEAKNTLYNAIGLGALKYFILKVDPKKNMLFNPAESIDFNGNTGPFIQYTHARIRSILRNAGLDQLDYIQVNMAAHKLNLHERTLLRSLYEFPEVVNEAAQQLSPSEIANYSYELCKEFNQFYHEHSVLNEPDREISDFRIKLSQLTAQTIKNAMFLLGIDVPERM